MNLAEHISRRKENVAHLFIDGKLVGEMETLKIEPKPIYEIGNVSPRSFTGSGQLTIDRLNLRR